MATDVVMPQMGESIAEGTITKWLKNVGDHVDRDEPLFEISTDKVDAEIPAPAAGTLTEIKFKEGETVEVNTVVAVLDGEGARPAAEAAVEAAAATEQEIPAPAPEPAPVETKPEELRRSNPAPPVITPEPVAKPAPAPAPAAHKTEVKQLVKRSDAGVKKAEGGSGATAEFASHQIQSLVRPDRQHGIDIKGLEGTGMSGRVTKDILSFINRRPCSVATAAGGRVARRSGRSRPPRPAAGDRVEQMSVMRKKIAGTWCFRVELQRT